MKHVELLLLASPGRHGWSGVCSTCPNCLGGCKSGWLLGALRFKDDACPGPGGSLSRPRPKGPLSSFRQAQLQDYIVRLAAIPAVQMPLEYIAEAHFVSQMCEPIMSFCKVGIVQDVSHAALGQRKMSPEAELKQLAASCTPLPCDLWYCQSESQETMLWLFLMLAGLVGILHSANIEGCKAGYC